MKWDAFRALRHRNFKLFFYGQILSMSGTWVQRVAQGWLAYELTSSPLLLGYVAFASSAPAIVLSPLAGVLTDRVDRHRMLIAAQILAMVQSTLLGLLAMAGAMTPVRLVLFALILGVITAFENPTRQAFFVQMVSREDLPNAIALNASLVSAARIVGPAAAGILVAAYGTAICFLVNSASFVAVLVALLSMKLPTPSAAGASGSGLQAMLQGFSFFLHNGAARSVLILFAIMSFAGTPYLTLMPILASDVLRIGPHGLGWLVAASGVGALAVAIGLAFRAHPSELLRQLRPAALVLGGSLVLLGWSEFFFVSLAMMPLIGGGYLMVLAGTQTLLQTWVSESLRGRVMSFYSLVFVGVPPFGSLFAGWLAERIGVPLTLVLGGLMCLLAGLRYPGRQRPLYEPAPPHAPVM